jgi:hypothetical protein
MCRFLFSLYYMPGAGQTDGADSEHQWAAEIGLACSIQEMSPGHCQDILNHCCRSNSRPLIFCLFLCPWTGLSHATHDLHTQLCAQGAHCHCHCHVNDTLSCHCCISVVSVSRHSRACQTPALSMACNSASPEASPCFLPFPQPSSPFSQFLCLCMHVST